MAFTAHHSGIRAEELPPGVLSTHLFLEAYFYFIPNYKFAEATGHELKILSSCFQKTN